VYTADCLSILSECTVWFLTVIKALIGNQREYSLLAGLWLVKLFHGLLHYVDQILKFGSPLNYFGGFLESFLKDKLKKPSKRINAHLHRVHLDILILICSQESQQFGLVLQGRYCFLWSMPQYVFCGTNLLSLDEVQVNGEGDSNTEMLGFSDKCSDSDDSEVAREDNTDHSLGEYSVRCSKSGKSEHIFQVPKQS
jgi:hypothetical protein